MIDWSIVVNIAGGGYGITILVLVILSVLAWVMGIVIQKTQAQDEETTEKKEG
jgi:Na+-transporting methylmalonyl-CoA/oxaloacetate decarboxylase gamma subunit